ncbi:unnamed protein product [Spodoptera littoralis]|uniref:Uncharacterized protein n=1 Tax=Spodoptera littoralis TaxID=7109 RepID=A0A9P0IGF5_SPOLI|nr:unnamed protein product [Spodoptera littoralis]CAH1647132.1 unnamed protein product [Spodoptera littoralis]
MILEPTEELERPELDEEIMCLLGQTPSKEKKLGSDIQKDLALRLEHITTMGLKKESRKEIIENNLIPSNCTKINAPKLNPEIKAALSEILIKKDNALEAKQVQIAATISCLGNALTKIFLSDFKDQAVIKSLIEASRLLCDTQHRESMTRRSFICSSIKKDFKEQLYNTEVDSFLFGEKLADTLKAAKAISKSGAEIKVTMKKTVVPQKASQVPAQILNQKPPLPPTRRTGVARRAEPAAAPAPRSRQQQPLRHSTRSQRHHALRH